MDLLLFPSVGSAIYHVEAYHDMIWPFQAFPSVVRRLNHTLRLSAHPLGCACKMTSPRPRQSPRPCANSLIQGSHYGQPVLARATNSS